MQILHLDSSILGTASASRVLSAAIVAQLCHEHPAVSVLHRDLARDGIPHLTGAIAAGFRETGITAFDEVTKAEHRLSEKLVTEFLASDIVVIGAPMYNFSVSSQLKAWFDRIAQVGRTFKYTATGPVGLSGGRRVFIASSRGGLYSSGPAAVMDFQENYLKGFFKFLGIDDVTIVRAEGLSKGADVRGTALEEALTSIRELTSELAA